METRSLGSLQATVVGLGCNNFGGRCDQAQTTAVIDACLEHGITYHLHPGVWSALRSHTRWLRVMSQPT